MASVFFQGFFLQASLILAFGAQNIFVLNSGLRKQRHLLVASLSSICDTILTFVGVLGFATVFIQFPLLKICLGIVGVGFLLLYGILKLKDAKLGASIDQTESQGVTLKQTVFSSLGFSLLNPHAYLDTIVLLGGYSAKFSDFSQRFFFGAGASAFSTVWFFGLALLASLAGRFLNNPKAMRYVSLLSGIILTLLSVKLGSDVFGWVREFLV